MKKCLYTVFSFIKRVFLFIRLHIHVEAGIRGSNNNEEPNSHKED